MVSRGYQLPSPDRTDQFVINTHNPDAQITSERQSGANRQIRFGQGHNVLPETRVLDSNPKKVSFGSTATPNVEHSPKSISFSTSNDEATNCPICRRLLNDDEVARCEDCGTRFHVQCWSEHTSETEKPCPFCGSNNIGNISL
jgi:hypothetical protein